jgi:hypothetical protein
LAIGSWTREELTVEQAIGQILLWLKEQERKRKEAAKATAAERPH